MQQNRKRLKDTENNQMVTMGEGGRGMSEIGERIKRYTFPVIR